MACFAPLLTHAAMLTPADLQAAYSTRSSALAASPFKRPLLLQSMQLQDGLVGDIYAVVDHAMPLVRDELSLPGHWCDILLLHSNVKQCHTSTESGASRLAVYIGTKDPQELARSSRADFSFQVVAATADYLEVVLAAPSGPMGTSDYRILLQAVPLPGGKAFLHFTYSYNVNALGRMAMGAYLMTGGAGKVGFTVKAGTSADAPQYIDGVLGLLERNTMRYFLAIDTFLQFAHTPSESRWDKRMRAFFTAVEQYPRQLHEMDWQTYEAMKRAEYARQQAAR